MCSEEKSTPKAGLCLLRLSEALDCEVKDCSFLIPKKTAVSLHQKSENYGDYNIARITRSYRSGFDGCYSDFSTHAFLIGKAHKKERHTAVTSETVQLKTRYGVAFMFPVAVITQ